jgi:hypothetical protein
MSDRVKGLLAQYETKLKRAEAEHTLKNAARLAFNDRAETALMNSVKPVLARLATALKGAGHKAWTHEHFWVSEEPKGEYTNVQLYCRLKSIRPNADSGSIALSLKHQAFGSLLTWISWSSLSLHALDRLSRAASRRAQCKRWPWSRYLNRELKISWSSGYRD